MSLHAGQKNYHEVCANYLSHSAISSIDSGKGIRFTPGFYPRIKWGEETVLDLLKGGGGHNTF